MYLFLFTTTLQCVVNSLWSARISLLIIDADITVTIETLERFGGFSV